MKNVQVILLDPSSIQCIALCVTSSILLCFNAILRHVMGKNIFCMDLVPELYISFAAQPSLSRRKPLQQPVASLYTGNQLTGSVVLGWGAQRAGLAFRECKNACACVRVCVLNTNVEPCVAARLHRHATAEHWAGIIHQSKQRRSWEQQSTHTHRNTFIQNMAKISPAEINAHICPLKHTRYANRGSKLAVTPGALQHDDVQWLWFLPPFQMLLVIGVKALDKAVHKLPFI